MSIDPAIAQALRDRFDGAWFNGFCQGLHLAAGMCQTLIDKLPDYTDADAGLTLTLLRDSLTWTELDIAATGSP